MSNSVSRNKLYLPIRIKQSGGFSLFELVVFIICVAIIYSAASNRFAEFPGEAERANFLAVSAQIQAAVNLEMMMGILASNQEVISRYETANPMDFLLEAPSNYLGAYYLPDAGRLPRRSWYFDQSSNELVYLINDAEGVYLLRDGEQVPTTELRFHIEIDYRYRDTITGLPVEESSIDDGPDTGDRIRRSLAGMVLRPVSPYVWGTSPTFMADYGSTQAPG